MGTAIPFGPPLAQEELTLPEALDQGSSGYSHAAFGKWHLGGSTLTAEGALDPNLQGYGHYAGLLAGAFVTPFTYELWPETTNGATAIQTRYATSENVDDALRWIDARRGPWFCWLAFNAPHTPFHAPPAELHGQDLPDTDPCLDPVPFYDAMVEAMDAEIGRLLTSLDPAVRARTTVIFVADNGTTGDVTLPPFPADHAKSTLYEGGVHVPLVVSGAGIVAPGREVAALVNTTDLFATVLELCGVDPGGAAPDSVSLVPHLLNPFQAGQRDWIFAEIFQGSGGGGVSGPALGGAAVPQPGPAACLGAGVGITQGKAIRGPVFKLIRFDGGDEEFYNLVLDPFEQNDLLKLPGGPLSPIAKNRYEELAAALDALLASG